MSDDGSSWQDQRRAAAAEHAAAFERRKAQEAQQARAIVADFVREAKERGLRPTALSARGYDGRARYRTGLEGWYVRRDGSLAVGTDGEFYLLTVPTSLRARFTGVEVHPDDPPLVVGAGGRDGESMPLGTLLRQRLDAGDDWP
ncbi:MAG: hypothetical protein M3P48_02165 [Actinomycetota bacterium]|nr:hypothetical protein [Actinomycetota bacterium]